jgi:hypothetical protein
MNAFSASDVDIDPSADVSGAVQADSQILRDAEARVLYAYAPRGAAQIAVYGSTTQLMVRATFPGRVVLSPAQFELYRECALLLDSGDSEDAWHIAAFHDNGTAGQYTGGGTVDMTPGWVTLLVTRRGDDSCSFARVRVNLTPEPQTLDLLTLSYEAYAKVTLVFSGRGSPDSPFDAWWFHDEQPAPLLQALDQSFGGSPRYVSLGEPDRVLPDGRLEFTYDNRMLPPGRYKVIPWHGAVEKYCKTFTLAPGSVSTVVVEGG